MDCPQCGVRNQPANAVCSRCGASLPDADRTAAARGSRVFRNPKRLTWWLQSLLIGIIALEVVLAASQLMRLRPGSVAETHDLFQTIFGTGLLLVYIATIVMFCVWTYRVNANLHALGAANLRFSPGWAVGWYFVPVANLWKPYQVMSEIWRASRNPSGWQYDASSSIVGWWWFWWIVSNVQVTFETSSQPEALDASVSPIGLILWALDIIAPAFATLVVKRVGAFQAEASDRSLSAIFA
jgi:hypothetical protein